MYYSKLRNKEPIFVMLLFLFLKLLHRVHILTFDGNNSMAAEVCLIFT